MTKLDLMHSVKNVTMTMKMRLFRLSERSSDRSTSQKLYCKIVNKVMNVTRVTLTPPLFVNNRFKTYCKAQPFNTFFAKQYKLVRNSITLPQFRLNTATRIKSTFIYKVKKISSFSGVLIWRLLSLVIWLNYAQPL